MNLFRGLLLLACAVTAPNAPALTFSELAEKSNAFHKKTSFPTQANRIAAVAKRGLVHQKEIAAQARQARVIMTAETKSLIRFFLSHKRCHGTAIERQFYRDMSADSLLKRLITQRPLMFMTAQDTYLLRDKSQEKGGFEKIGTSQEVEPLVLANYLSYDEMQISALLGVSSPTFFINNGSRNNQGKRQPSNTFEKLGVYTGLVGARFEKPGLMEWQHIIITPEQNTAENGYGRSAARRNPKTKLLRIWQRFYGENFATFEQAAEDTSGRYIKLGAKMLLDTHIYKKRLRAVIAPFLTDANNHGKQREARVYCHAVGLGLGVWKKTPQQAELMLEVYAELLKQKHFPYISDIDFSWFPDHVKTCGDTKNSQTLTENGNTIKIHFSHRNPADKLTGDNEGKLLVAMYAWDGNAYPGNEYWAGHLSASGDPAAACCSTIAELQNPLINTQLACNRLVATS